MYLAAAPGKVTELKSEEGVTASAGEPLKGRPAEQESVGSKAVMNWAAREKTGSKERGVSKGSGDGDSARAARM